MKFTGLILICATSCLALILPAIGVVHFPKAQLADASGSSNKLGMEIWLLLGPVCLIGLAMWSFSPNPSAAKPKS